MPWVVGVTFKPVTKVYYFDPAGFEDLQVGERVVVDTSRGRTLGTVTFTAREVPESEVSGTLKPVVRRAAAWDLVQQDQADHREAETLALCRERAAALNLDMKMVDVEYNFDATSLLVYFIAEQRVDFRQLVHDLAQALHTRVEMRQIGVRDQAKALGGLGRCGLSLCCASWLREFTPVSIKMAKQQDLPLNPAEISGACGRLLCCLSYEDEYYGEARRQMPRLNSTVMTPEGPGKVRQVHVLRNSVTAQVQGPNDTKMLIEVPLLENGQAAGSQPGGCPGCPAFAASSDAEDVLPDDEEESGAELEVEARLTGALDEDQQESKAPGAQGNEERQPAKRRSRSRRRPR